ncbi:MAG: molybdopterin-dependent oxidoreductase [Flavobacteriales bacterium]
MRVLLLPVLALLPFLAAGQAEKDTATVQIVHGTACDARVTLEQLRSVLSHHIAPVRNHDGKDDTYEGAWLQEVLELACPSIAAIDKRTRIRSAVRVTAADGYSALIALSEADTAFRDRPVLLCWKWNGQPLGERHGPFQLIVPDDNRHARDVRNVTKLEVITP